MNSLYRLSLISCLVTLVLYCFTSAKCVKSKSRIPEPISRTTKAPPVTTETDRTVLVHVSKRVRNPVSNLMARMPGFITRHGSKPVTTAVIPKTEPTTMLFRVPSRASRPAFVRGGLRRSQYNQKTLNFKSNLINVQKHFVLVYFTGDSINPGIYKVTFSSKFLFLLENRADRGSKLYLAPTTDTRKDLEFTVDLEQVKDIEFEVDLIRSKVQINCHLSMIKFDLSIPIKELGSNSPELLAADLIEELATCVHARNYEAAECSDSIFKAQILISVSAKIGGKLMCDSDLPVVTVVNLPVVTYVGRYIMFETCPKKHICTYQPNEAANDFVLYRLQQAAINRILRKAGVDHFSYFVPTTWNWKLLFDRGSCHFESTAGRGMDLE